MDDKEYVAEIQSWVDDTHPDVLKHVAVEVLRESEPDPGDGDRPGGRLRRFVRFLTDGESPPPDAHLYLANRRLRIGILEASELVGVRITPQTYPHLSEYASLVDVHEAEGRATSGTAAERAKASEDAMTDRS